MFLSLFLGLLGLVFIASYVWYLTWPVVEGRVVKVHQGVSDISQVRGARAYRLIVYEYMADSKKYTSNRQSFFIKAALGPKKPKGDELTISVCRPFPSLSSPRRPFVEGMILFGILLLILLVAFVFMLYRLP